MTNFTINSTNLDNLELFKKLLKKDENRMVNEALELYFKEEAEKLQDENSSQTNLSFDEFWDDVDI